jgi:hypothetical protein
MLVWTSPYMRACSLNSVSEHNVTIRWASFRRNNAFGEQSVNAQQSDTNCIIIVIRCTFVNFHSARMLTSACALPQEALSCACIKETYGCTNGNRPDVDLQGLLEHFHGETSCLR